MSTQEVSVRVTFISFSRADFVGEVSLDGIVWHLTREHRHCGYTAVLISSEMDSGIAKALAQAAGWPSKEPTLIEWPKATGRADYTGIEEIGKRAAYAWEGMNDEANNATWELGQQYGEFLKKFVQGLDDGASIVIIAHRGILRMAVLGVTGIMLTTNLLSGAVVRVEVQRDGSFVVTERS